jgi:hypothetical protein
MVKSYRGSAQSLPKKHRYFRRLTQSWGSEFGRLDLRKCGICDTLVAGLQGPC